MIALRNSAPDIVASQKVVPIIDPILEGPLTLAFEKFVDAGMRFCLIANPQTGPFANRPMNYTREQLFDAYLDDYDQVIPTFYVTHATSVQEVADFVNNYEGRRAFFFLGNPARSVVDAIVAAEPTYVIFLQSGGIPNATKNRFSAAVSVDLAESFHPAQNNASFPDTEFFSEQHLTTPNADFEHFGDYSIVGKDLATGFAPYCVAIHYVYHEDGSTNSDLWIAHYKSDTNDTQDDPGGKYSEALDKLLADLPNLGATNRTRITGEFESDHASSHFPGLPTLKRRGIEHHILLICNML